MNGMDFLATILTAVTAVRLLGLVLDGRGPFTVFVLKPEVAIVILSSLALFVERRRSRRLASAP